MSGPETGQILKPNNPIPRPTSHLKPELRLCCPSRRCCHPQPVLSHQIMVPRMMVRPVVLHLSAVARGRFSKGGFWIRLRIGCFRDPGGFKTIQRGGGGFAPPTSLDGLKAPPGPPRLRKRPIFSQIQNHPLLNPREMALELVSGADFWCKLTCGAGPADLRGSRGPRGRPDPENDRC